MNYVLAILSALPLLAIGIRHKDGFNRLFAVASFLFALAFYCVPLAFAANVGAITYLGLSTPFNDAARNDALLAMLLFSLGFFGWDLTYSARSEHQAKRRLPSSGQLQEALSFILPIVIFAISVWLIYYVITTNYYEQSRVVRMKQAEGNYLVTTILLSTYYANCLMLIVSLTRGKYYSAAIWFVLAILLIINFGGRMQVGIVLLIPFVHFVRHRGILIAIGIVGGVVFLPLILDGKMLIAAIAGDGNIMAVVNNAYRGNLDIGNVLNNFSHPLISYHYSPTLVQNIGYRYFWDIPQGFLFYLRLVGLNFGDSLTYYNTELLLSRRESIIPPGYLAFGYVQANLFGVLVMGAIFRMAGRLAEVVKDYIGPRAPAADFFLAFLAANTFYIGEVRGLVLTFIFPCVLLYIVVRLTGTRDNQRLIARPVRPPSYSTKLNTALGPPRH